MGRLKEHVELGLAVNIPVEILLRDVEVLQLILHELVVRDIVMLEALRPEVVGGDAEVRRGRATVFQLLFDGQGLVNRGRLEGLRKGVQLDVHVLGQFTVFLLFQLIEGLHARLLFLLLHESSDNLRVGLGRILLVVAFGHLSSVVANIAETFRSFGPDLVCFLLEGDGVCERRRSKDNHSFHYYNKN